MGNQRRSEWPPRRAAHDVSSRSTSRPENQTPYIIEVEATCKDCGGSGYDPGGIDPWGPEPCPVCQGNGTQRITKNYLAEALRIAGNPECLVPVERVHLVAIVQYCRQVVSAAMCQPKVPAFKHPRAGFKTSGHTRPARMHKVVQIERRKRRNVEIRPQRA